MTPHERDDLIESVASAWRPRNPHAGVLNHPAWHDLDDDARREAYAVALLERALEAALDPRGLSATARAVLTRIRGAV